MTRLAQAVGPEVCQQVQERLVALARQCQVVRGRRLRVDTAVVETNIHHPIDSILLGDGARVTTVRNSITKAEEARSLECVNGYLQPFQNLVVMPEECPRF